MSRRNALNLGRPRPTRNNYRRTNHWDQHKFAIFGGGVLDECPYCGKMTDVSRRTCHNCGWILTRRVNK